MTENHETYYRVDTVRLRASVPGLPDSYTVVDTAAPADYDHTDERAVPGWGEPTIVMATADEVSSFDAARASFETAVASAERRRLEALEAYKKIEAETRNAIHEAWTKFYAPVEADLDTRMAATKEAYDEHQYRMELEETRIAQQRQAAEDAELGLRKYLVHRPRFTSITMRSFDMNVPTLHRVDGCAMAKKFAAKSAYHAKPRRIGEAFALVREGSKPWVNTSFGWRDDDSAAAVIPGRLCEACGVAADAFAHDPEVFEAWRAEADTFQPRLPTPARLKDLFERVSFRYSKVTAGGSWTPARPEVCLSFMRHGLVKPYEQLICFTEPVPDTRHLRTKDDATAEFELLAEDLPTVGLTVRRVSNPPRARSENDHPSLSPFYFALRAMTGGEKRALREKATSA